jgi:hypothetical protein
VIPVMYYALYWRRNETRKDASDSLGPTH